MAIRRVKRNNIRKAWSYKVLIIMRYVADLFWTHALFGLEIFAILPFALPSNCINSIKKAGKYAIRRGKFLKETNKKT